MVAFVKHVHFILPFYQSYNIITTITSVKSVKTTYLSKCYIFFLDGRDGIDDWSTLGMNSDLPIAFLDSIIRFMGIIFVCQK